MTTCELISANGTWVEVRNVARATMGLKPLNEEPTITWKRRILLAEHSPIRLISYTWTWTDLPYWVAMHFRTHKVGVEHFIRTQRTDRTGVERGGLRQDAPVNYTMTANQQAIINISRKRLCMGVSPETRQAWGMVLLLLPPVLAGVCCPDCCYRGGRCYQIPHCKAGPQGPFIS